MEQHMSEDFSNPAFIGVLEDFRKQAIDFYGSETGQTVLSKDVEKCLIKKANAFVHRSPNKLFLFPCMNDLSNVQEDDDDEEQAFNDLSRRSSSSNNYLVPRPSRASRSGSESSQNINDFSSIISNKQLEQQTLISHKSQE